MKSRKRFLQNEHPHYRPLKGIRLYRRIRLRQSGRTTDPLAGAIRALISIYECENGPKCFKSKNSYHQRTLSCRLSLSFPYLYNNMHKYITIASIAKN